MRDRLMSSGFLLGAILLHVVVFLMVATWILFAPPAELPDIVFSPVITKPPPPPPPAPPAPAGGGSQNPLEPQTVVTPPSNPPAIVHVVAPASFNVTASKVILPNLPDSFTVASGTSLGDSGATGSDLGSGSPFGVATSDQPSFSGTFYDFKQSPDHVSTHMTSVKDADKEQDILKDFFANNWDEATFKRNYLSSRKPLFANEIMIPFQYSTGGPAAFGLQDECKPGFWAIVYHVKINPTRSGTFNLAGFGDDFLVARVNGVIVLDAGYYPPVTDFKRTTSYRAGPWLDRTNAGGNKTYGDAVVGDKFHVNAGDELTIDVLISDAYPAGGKGRCGYFLYLLDKEYTAKDDKGNFVLPLLQIHTNPNVKRDGEYPPFTCRPEDALINSPPPQ